MTLRANEIGADVYKPTEQKLDKNNLDTKPQETMHEHAYPELSPGRALLDVATGTLYEIMHRVHGITNTVERKKSAYQEKMDFKYGTPEGQSWGGIIQHYHIAYAKRQSPTPNKHGEIQAPLTRPSENEITDIQPSAFRDVVLNDNDGEPRPLLLLERPEVTYEEVMPGDSYDVIGWFYPNGETTDDRVRAAKEIPHRFPDLADVDYTTTELRTLPSLGIRIPWTEDMQNVEIAPGDEDTFDISTTRTGSEFHLEARAGKIHIDSPFDAKDDIKSLSAGARWNGENKVWTVDNSKGSLLECINTFTTSEWTFTINAALIDQHCEQGTDVTPDEYIYMSVADILTEAFTEEIETGDGIHIPGLNATVDTDTDAAVIEFTNTEDGITAAPVESPSSNHVKALIDGNLAFDCPKDNAGTVKSLDWGDAKYKWDNSHGGWTLNQTAMADLITTFLDAGESITASFDVIAAVGDEEIVTETHDIDVDNDAVTRVNEYTADADLRTSLVETPDDVDDDADVRGITPTDGDALTLTALDMTLADMQDTGGMSVEIAGGNLGSVPRNVVSQWGPAMTEDDTFGWHHPETGARVEVVEVDGWGTEYEVHAADSNQTTTDHIVTLADERMVVQTVISHLKAMTQSKR